MNADGMKFIPVNQVNVKTEEVDEALSLIGGTAHSVHNEPKCQDGKGCFIKIPSVPWSDSHDYTAEAPPDSSGFYFHRILPQGPSATHPPSTQGADHAARTAYVPTLISSSIPGTSTYVTEAAGRKNAHQHSIPYTDSEGNEYGNTGFQSSHDIQNVDAGCMPSNMDFFTNIPGFSQQFATYPGQYAADIASQPIIPGSSAFPMNVDPSNLDFDVGWLASGNLPPLDNTQIDSQTANIDAMIEDTWRTIMGDPRFTNTGVTEPSL